ncbi:MAG: class I SAM-dependent methyltransferase [Acidobacteriota bacterium]
MRKPSSTALHPGAQFLPPNARHQTAASQDRSAAARGRYIRNQMHGVPGFLTTLDAMLMNCILDWQHQRGIAGNLCEIGVHHGRSFLLLALARQDGEVALGIDLFEDDEFNATGIHSERNGAVQRHAQRLGIPLTPREIFKRSSLDLKPADILDRAGGAVRFFSIDGGHRYRHVANDLPLAASCMDDRGIIAVDDFFNPDWPEVSLATMEFLRRRQDCVPFLVGANKIYLCRPAVADLLRHDIVANRPRGSRADSLAEFFESEYAVVSISLLARLWERLRQKLRA